MSYSYFTKRSAITDNFLPAYDYIVIGGGSAGCVIANRLSEDLKTTVLLLEAGPSHEKKSALKVPAKTIDLHNDPNFDWSYKVLGGCSSINFMVYIRGCKGDYDTWQEMGAQGWNFESVLPYFIKSENNIRPEFRKDPAHGVGGPVTVTDPSFTTPVTDAFVKAGVKLGNKECDINSGVKNGFDLGQLVIKNGQRQSTAASYLTSKVLRRRNLAIGVNCLVRKVVFKENKAVGVEFSKNDKIITISCNSEVIVCGGVIGSPQILLLSGVGPKEDLEKLEIPVVANLPVGRNMQDHNAISISSLTKDLQNSTLNLKSATKLSSILKYLFKGKGVIASSGYLASGFVNAVDDSDALPWPDTQIHLFGYGVLSDKFYYENLGYNKEKHFPLFIGNSMAQDQEGFTLVPVLLHPKSRGTVKLRSTDPAEYPDIDPKYYDDPDDLTAMAKIVQYAIKLLETEPLCSYIKEVLRYKIDSSHEYNSIEYWKDVIRVYGMDCFHPVGTCKMGAVDDPTTVVDSDLRIHGLDGIRVADASIMPCIVSGNTNAACMMIGSKAFFLWR
ncbi:uncharacterized protein TRIADDRAFT_53208 [Trichoplax adhaerens]|uniref:Glucose-methanol-choline oxidoreductase N-terminal domain-containing protein n=1 Tax=Trichoplax adhaerens TaxID=10228 RepID=B3RNL5_TRIAD|nr:hypothetical protein TRIADDRAFT_53208 [Trichoplax adhaerens]EDV28039.1 hypothetical protein TRIADDRAFT_53208 [Trichoplax adhaerens]|eukprot:XP_002109873.1 hypothetical protein TRIADDRAFT_53208 [Trichoplax adhaerens]